ncbi:hypothetical protein ACLOJK_021067 [Asimina triloba]
MSTSVLSSTPILGRKPNSYLERMSSRALMNASMLGSKKKQNLVWCRNNSGNMEASFVSKTMETGVMVADPNNGLMNDGSLLLSPNALEELVPDYSGMATTLPDFRQGLGIVRFLRGKGFFITGATGFLAKVLVEKILRTVPDVSRIFLLIKAKSKEAAIERMNKEIIYNDIFKCLKETHGKSYEAFMLSKLVPVVGNVTEDNLGIEEDLEDQITEEVEIIINSAANTTFDERYDFALNINTKGPSRVMSLAKRCKRLELFCQVSTAYVNGQRQGKVSEKPFRLGDSIARERMASESSPTALPQLDVEAELKLGLNSKGPCEDNAYGQKMREIGLESADHNEFWVNRAKSYGWQDTYVFTKAMGEMLVESERGEIPAVIIRPSIIESTYMEPFPGWMEGSRMLDPIILCYGKGQIPGFPGNPRTVLDIVPADMVVNATLAAIAKHGSAGKPGLKVYHVASSVENPFELQALAGILHEYFKEKPYIDSKGRAVDVSQFKLFSSTNEFSNLVLSDAVERAGGQTAASNGKQSQRPESNIPNKTMEKMMHMANIYEPYSFYAGRFDNKNTRELVGELSEEEKKAFCFDVGMIEWKDYIASVHIPGLARHVLKGRGIRCL